MFSRNSCQDRCLRCLVPKGVMSRCMYRCYIPGQAKILYNDLRWPANDRSIALEGVHHFSDILKAELAEALPQHPKVPNTLTHMPSRYQVLRPLLAWCFGAGIYGKHLPAFPSRHHAMTRLSLGITEEWHGSGHLHLLWVGLGPSNAAENRTARRYTKASVSSSVVAENRMHLLLLASCY